MDIGNIYSQYADAYTNAANSTAKQLEGKFGNKDLKNASDEELMDACKQFESYFLEQMFKEMVKTIPSENEREGSTKSMLDFYKDEMVKNIASQSTETNSLGLAQMLYEQMKRNYDM